MTAPRRPDAELESLRDDFLAHLAQTIPGRKELVVDSASGCTVRSADGREYLDLISGVAVANVGHAHPAVVEAVSETVRRMTHVNVYGRFVIPQQVEVGRALARLAPGRLEQSFLTSTGTEAIEGALKLCRKASGRPGILAFERAFHGRTFGSLSVSWKERYRRPFEPLLPGVRFAPFGDLDAVADAIDGEVGTVIAEPVQGEGGVRLPPDGFLEGLRRLCDERGALLILDEVQTGMGRTGRWFACEHWGVEPDVLVTAKALGGGLPLGAFVSRPELMATLLDPPLTHLTTFGGNPVCCAAALAAIGVIESEGLVERAVAVGERLAAGLEGLVHRGPLLSEQRGLGMLRAVQFRDPDLALPFCREAEARGVLVGAMLNAEGVVRVAPPLVISEAELDRGLGAMAAALDALAPVGAGAGAAG